MTNILSLTPSPSETSSQPLLISVLLYKPLSVPARISLPSSPNARTLTVSIKAGTITGPAGAGGVSTFVFAAEVLPFGGVDAVAFPLAAIVPRLTAGFFGGGGVYWVHV